MTAAPALWFGTSGVLTCTFVNQINILPILYLKFGPGFDSSNFVSHNIGVRKVSGYEVISTRRFKKRSVSLPWMLENIIWAHILYLMQYLDFLPKSD